jgi:hypothetical protein
MTMMIVLTCDYPGGPDHRDQVFEEIVGAAGGEFSGSGCWVLGEPRRDVEAVFEIDPDREAVAKQLGAAGFENVRWNDEEE